MDVSYGLTIINDDIYNRGLIHPNLYGLMRLALLLDTVRQHLWSKGDLVQGLRGRDLG